MCFLTDLTAILHSEAAPQETHQCTSCEFAAESIAHRIQGNVGLKISLALVKLDARRREEIACRLVADKGITRFNIVGVDLKDIYGIHQIFGDAGGAQASDVHDHLLLVDAHQGPKLQGSIVQGHLNVGIHGRNGWNGLFFLGHQCGRHEHSCEHQERQQ